MPARILPVSKWNCAPPPPNARAPRAGASTASCSALRRGTEMRNFVQPGNVLTAVAPTGGVSSGDGLLVGAALFGVCAYDALEAAEVEVSIEGVYNLPKPAGVIAQGTILYWDAGAGQAT